MNINPGATMSSTEEFALNPERPRLGRVFTRHMCKPGDILGEYQNQWVAGAKADMRFDRLDDNSATDILDAPVCRSVPAVHISGLGMYGEKRPCMTVMEMARCRTVWPGKEREPEDYPGCILRTRTQYVEDSRYDREPTFPEYIDCDHIITPRGIYKGWREHDEPVFGTGDVLSWIIEARKRRAPELAYMQEHLRSTMHARAVRLVLETMVGYGVHGTRIGSAEISVGAKLERVKRWAYTFRWSGNSKEAASLADAACRATTPPVRGGRR